MNPQTRFVVFIAPTCAGKGYVMKLIKDFVTLVMAMKLLRVSFISFGDIVKGLVETDEDFNAKYGKSMAHGNLIDDPTAINIYQREIDRVMQESPHFIFVDGFGRSASQIAYMMNNGHLNKQARVFMIEVSQVTCMKRFMHRNENASKKRIDAEIDTFNKRYDLHRDTSPNLRAMLKDSDCKLIDINGEGDLMNSVGKEIKDILQDEILATALWEMGQVQQVRS